MFASIKLGAARRAVTVLGVFEGTKRAPASLGDDRAGANALLGRAGFSGKTGQAEAGDGVLLLGMGKKGDLDTPALRALGGQLVRTLESMEQHSATIELHRSVPLGVADATTLGQALAEGMSIANWRVDAFDGNATKRSPRASALRIASSDGEVAAGIKRGLVLGDAVNTARRIAATPPNICNPPWMAREAHRVARSCGLRCSVISFSEAQKQGMGGICNVGKGSASKPCMIILEHAPRGRSGDDVLCLVGKTMTYDSGGYSLKINNSMKGMKYDKNGGMAVLGAMQAIAALKLPIRVVALMPCAENMVSSEAYRPDDIITMFNGVSVEVTNTDAEGRLILGDALAYACKKYKPSAIIDLATLTGGVVVALGSACAGLWCEDNALRRQVEKAADASGERVWRLPLWEEYRDMMRAKHADILNSAPVREAHPIQGAAFLSYFVEKDIPWAHVDIAGVSVVDSDKGLVCAGPTGWGVRLLTELVASRC